MFSKKASRPSWSLAARLTTWYTLAFFVLALLMIAVLYWGLVASLTLSEDLILADKIHILRAILRDRPEAMYALRREVQSESAARREYGRLYVRLLDNDGEPILTTPGMDALLPPDAFPVVVPRHAEPRHGVEIESDRRSFRTLAAEATVGPSEHESRLIQVAVDRGHSEMLLARYRQRLNTMLAIAVVACPLVAYRIARRGLQPLREISETAWRTGSATLGARIESAGYPVELADLAHTFNAMLDRLQDSFGRLSQWSADIAHELRTPIHNIRGEAEVALSRPRSAEEYKEALTSCLEESVRLSDLIGRLLFLARVENPGTQLEREPVHIARELDAVRDYYVDAAVEARVTLSVEASADVVIAVDRGLLQRAVGNLVTNSLAHTPPGGSILLAARVDHDRLRVKVCDNGAGIPAQHLPRVFDRFYRADPSRSSRNGSMGLGLAIVKGIVTLHGGEIEIQSEVGKGTRIALILPMGSPAAHVDPGSA